MFSRKQPGSLMPPLVLRIVGGVGGPVIREMHLPGELVPMSNVLYAMYEGVFGETGAPDMATFEHTVDWGHVPDRMFMPMFDGLEALLRAYAESNRSRVRDFGKDGENRVQAYRASYFERPAVDHLSLALVGGGNGQPYTAFEHPLSEKDIDRVQTAMSKAGLHSPWDMLGTAALFQVAFLLDMPYLMYAIKKYRYKIKGRDYFFDPRLKPGLFDHGLLIYCENCKKQFATGTCRTCKRGRYCGDACREAGHIMCDTNALYVDPAHSVMTPLIHNYGIVHGFGHDALVELRAGIRIDEWTLEDHADPFLVGRVAAMCRRAYGTGEKGTRPAKFFDLESIAVVYPSDIMAQTLTKIGKGTSFGLDFLVSMNKSGFDRAHVPFLLQVNPRVASDIVKFKHLDALRIFAMNDTLLSVVNRDEVYVHMVDEDWPDGFELLLRHMDLAADDYRVIRRAQASKRTGILEVIYKRHRERNMPLPDIMK